MTDPPPRTPPSGQTTPISPAGVVSPVHSSVQDTGRDDSDPADELLGIPVAPQQEGITAFDVTPAAKSPTER
jgi:hypothetical protein